MDILIGAISAVAGAAISLAGVFVANRHTDRCAHRDAVGAFLAETYKELSFHTRSRDFSEACGRVKQFVSPEQCRLVDQVHQKVIARHSSENLETAIPPLLEEFLRLDSVCAGHRKRFSSSRP